MKRPWLTTVFLVLAASHARAAPFFPEIVAEVTGAASPPPCTICHSVPTGGVGTASKPLASLLLARGLVPGDGASLRRALAAIGAEGTDLDGDGLSDVAALRIGLDPNPDTSEEPRFGCGIAGSAGQRPMRAHASLALGALGLAAFCARRRRSGRNAGRSR